MHHEVVKLGMKRYFPHIAKLSGEIIETVDTVSICGKIVKSGVGSQCPYWFSRVIEAGGCLGSGRQYFDLIPAAPFIIILIIIGSKSTTA